MEAALALGLLAILMFVPSLFVAVFGAVVVHGIFGLNVFSFLLDFVILAYWLDHVGGPKYEPVLETRSAIDELLD